MKCLNIRLKRNGLCLLQSQQEFSDLLPSSSRKSFIRQLHQFVYTQPKLNRSYNFCILLLRHIIFTYYNNTNTPIIFMLKVQPRISLLITLQNTEIKLIISQHSSNNKTYHLIHRHSRYFKSQETNIQLKKYQWSI